jgi:galacturonosyltransferase
MKEKGIDEYLEAARRIKKKYPDTVFNVIGFLEESEYSSIIQSAHNENIICFHGFQPDMLPFLQSGHCTVNPSYHEGMSNVLLESSACGRAVIASDISGCREITDDGVTGFLCEAKNAEDLADKLEKFIMLSYDEKVQMGLRGHEKMQREFDRNIVIKAYMKEIKKITGETNEQSDR